MSEEKRIRLNQAARQFNVGVGTIVEFLNKKNIAIENSPNTAIDAGAYALLDKEFGGKSGQKLNVREKIGGMKQETVSLDSRKEQAARRAEEEFDEVVVKGFGGSVVNVQQEIAPKPAPAPAPTPAPSPVTPATTQAPVPAPQPAVVETPKPEVVATPAAASVAQAPTNAPAAPVVEQPRREPQSERKPEQRQEPRGERGDRRRDERRDDRRGDRPAGGERRGGQGGNGGGQNQGGNQGGQSQGNQKKKERPPMKTVVAPSVRPDVVAQSQTYDERREADTTNVFRLQSDSLTGPKVLGKIDVSNVVSGRREKRKRIGKDKVDLSKQGGGGQGRGGRGGQGGAGAQGGHGGGQGRGGAGGGGAQGGGQGRGTAQGGRFGGGAQGGANAAGGGKKKRGGQNVGNRQPVFRAEVSDEEVQKQVKDTLARLTSKGTKSKSAKYRRDKRDSAAERRHDEEARAQLQGSTIQVTEFVTVSELATMMDVSVNEVIMACMNLGLMVSINQRLDAEALVVVAEEFGYKVEFVSAEIQEAVDDEDIDSEEDLQPRPPIVTVMGHVDHGKTSLLDNIRKTNVIAGEAGGITQHIGAYSVVLGGRRITFLDTPGHEAFTAMRARGASVTDVAIIIVAADDSVMPQTVEAINHATAAGVPMVFAINKIDKEGANPEHIKEQLAQMNYLVEDWGGKYQSQEVSAKQGLNLDKLLEKVLLEAEFLDLKANPDRKATGTVIESSLDKGRGYVSTVLVQNGTLHVGDILLAGTYTGRVKAMFDENGNKVTVAPPSTPVLVLGLNGAPQAGDTFNVMDDDKSARELANKREQLQRMQDQRTQKHVTLDEIGRRIAIGSFKELNIIVKGDVDGSVEAMTDSLIKLSKEEVQVNVIHKAVGQISESDVILAAASNAIIVAFQVRPSAAARKLAEKEEIEIRLYSIIYDAINDIKDAIDGMLAPITKEEIVCSVEVLETFKISKVGTIAGCIVREGKITRNTPIRVIRDGIVVYTGKLGSLKRFKDDVKEVSNGMECGLNIENYNDIKVGDIIEGYETVEVKR